MRDIYNRRLSCVLVGEDDDHSNISNSPRRRSSISGTTSNQYHSTPPRRPSMSNSMAFPTSGSARSLFSASHSSSVASLVDLPSVESLFGDNFACGGMPDDATAPIKRQPIKSRPDEHAINNKTGTDRDDSTSDEKPAAKHFFTKENADHDKICSICVNAMKPTDFAHPLQCRCAFNFCLPCVENMIISSKGDYEVASDGSMQVKTFLHCPGCRADLSSTIRDTVLLRQVYRITSCSEDDNLLTETQNEMKDALDDPEVQIAIAWAEKSEASFFSNNAKEEEGAIEVSLAGGERTTLVETGQISNSNNHDADNASITSCTTESTPECFESKGKKESYLHQLIVEAKKERMKSQAKRRVMDRNGHMPATA